MERRALGDARAGARSCADPDPRPLVTVRITTYRRAGLLVDRTLPSVLAQTYDNLEILVVGDATDDDTAGMLASVGDPRVRFVNLPYRPDYPTDPRKRWRVLGYAAANLALDLARGSWIAPCDDDDEFTPDHVEGLLETARREGAELVHSRPAARSA
jgi:glycosyltransferase involved in cell wall biosynthesis